MNATILVVDDEEGIRKLYQMELVNEGYNVILAADGQEALQKVEQENPDLIILDIRMPKVDGIEFLDRFTQTGKKLPIIINSAYTDYQMDITTWMADEYMSKDSDLTELKAEIKKLLIHYSNPLEAENYRLSNLVSDLAKENKRLREEIAQLQLSESGNGRTASKDADKRRPICGSVAHSLKSEFLNIGTSIKDIRELASDSSDIQEECDIIERSVEYSQLHLQRLLDYLDMGKPPIEPIDILELLRRAELLAEPRLPSSVQLETTIDPNIKKRIISANFEQLMGVLLELISNATNLLREKSGTTRLHLEGRDGEIAISVKDDGPGIPEEIRKDLFKKQVSSKRGLGLGLFLCNKVISALEGKLNLETSSEEGTEFTILLPVANDEEGSQNAVYQKV